MKADEFIFSWKKDDVMEGETKTNQINYSSGQNRANEEETKILPNDEIFPITQPNSYTK